MQFINYANLSKLRIKKMAWMSQGFAWKISICFTDHMSDRNPRIDILPLCREQNKITVPLGKSRFTDEHNGPNLQKDT